MDSNGFSIFYDQVSYSFTWFVTLDIFILLSSQDYRRVIGVDHWCFDKQVEQQQHAGEEEPSTAN